jgi:hypothetical protein
MIPWTNDNGISDAVVGQTIECPRAGSQVKRPDAGDPSVDSA